MPPITPRPRPPCSRLRSGPDRQAFGPQGAASRIAILEEGHVDLVERAPLGDVCEHHRALHHVRPRGAVRLEGESGVLHGLSRFGLDPPGDQFEGAWIRPDHPGEIEGVVHADRFRGRGAVGQDGPGVEEFHGRCRVMGSAGGADQDQDAHQGDAEHRMFSGKGGAGIVGRRPWG